MNVAALRHHWEMQNGPVGETLVKANTGSPKVQSE